MRRSWLLAWVVEFAGMLFGADAHGTVLVFEAVPTSPTQLCAAPCHEVRIFFEDPSRVLDVAAIQIGLQVGATVEVAADPSPVPTASGASATYRDSGGNLSMLPWDVATAVTETAPNVVFAAHLASSAFSLDSFASSRAATGRTCSVLFDRNCGIIEEADALNRVYLGAFPVSLLDGSDPSVSLRVTQLSGLGTAIAPLQESIAADPQFSMILPEPRLGPVLAVLVATTAVVRARPRAPAQDA